MKKVKMLYPAVLALCICFSCLCMTSGASAAIMNGYCEECSAYHDGNYHSWKNGSAQGTMTYESCTYNNVKYYIPLTGEPTELFRKKTESNGNYFYQSIYSNALYRAVYEYSLVDPVGTVYQICNPVKYSGGEFSLTFFNSESGVSIDLDCLRITDCDEWFYYTATGMIGNPDCAKLPDGWNLDEDGRPVKGQGDTIFSETFKVSFARGDTLWGLFDGNVTNYDASSFEKTVKDGYDKKMCFYKESLLSCVGNNASCLYVYTEKSASNNELITCNSDQGIDEDLFKDLSHSLISDDGVSADTYDIGGILYFPGYLTHSGGGGHCGDGTEDLVTRHFYSKENICEDYPVVVDGLYCLSDKSDYNFDLFRGFDILMDLTVIGSVAISFDEYMETTSVISHLETPDISRPVFSSKEAAAEWYQTSIVEDYHNDIVYKPSGYYYHKSTKILDTNPDGDDTSIDDEKDNNPFENSPGTDPAPVEPVNTVVSGSTVIVNVAQSNDNSYDSHDKITASATATASAIVNNNTGNDSGGMMELPDSDDDSLFDVIGDAVDDEDDDWLNLIKYAFGFLPEKIQTILNGSVIVSIIVGLLRRR